MKITFALSFDAQIAPDDPFLARSNFSAFMQQAILTVSMEQCHANLQLNHDRVIPVIVLARERLRRSKHGIEYCFSANAPGALSSQIY